ncbi:MAG: hypothetical protein IPK62_07560 [Bacteroidetes bacterium]|nr:hypothetical protein [Bacteroidota bacterium]MBK8144850.1 hypothetical protein [Bacteroidota bacterium]MBP6314281.1 hypothetical protein [Chitinophagaceae bacterium]
MDNTNEKKVNAFSSKLGLITGALLVALGLWLIFYRADSNKAIAYFMVIYGAFRLGLAVYANFLRKKRIENAETDFTQE